MLYVYIFLLNREIHLLAEPSELEVFFVGSILINSLNFLICKTILISCITFDTVYFSRNLSFHLNLLA